MDRLDAMVLFVTAVDEGSLAAAARRHGRSAASVSRAVAFLEELAGETLLLRSTRRLNLTSAGDRHVAVWRDVLTKLGEIEPAGAAGSLHGNMVLTAPELFGRLILMPVLEPFLREQPLISARVLLVNRLVDIVGEGVDIAIRLASLPDSTLTSIKLGEMRMLVCASPEYLGRAARPATPQELSTCDCIGLNAEGDAELWPFRLPSEKGARARSVRVPTRLSVNSAAAAIDAALRGQGVIRVRAYQVAEHIAAGRLVPVLGAFEPPPEPVNIVFHPDRGRLGPVRAFIEHAVPALRSELRRVSLSVGAFPSWSDMPSHASEPVLQN